MSMWETPTGPAGGDDIALTTPTTVTMPGLGAAAGDTSYRVTEFPENGAIKRLLGSFDDGALTLMCDSDDGKHGHCAVGDGLSRRCITDEIRAVSILSSHHPALLSSIVGVGIVQPGMNIFPCCQSPTTIHGRQPYASS